MEIETITVQLGDRQFEVKEPTWGYARRWRKQLAESVKPLLEQVSGVTEFEFNTPADLLKLLPVVETTLVDGLDNVFELLVSYSPVLENERAWIEDNATEKQIINAFKEIVKFSGPFRLIKMVSDLPGSQTNGISKNLLDLSGESAPTASPSDK